MKVGFSKFGVFVLNSMFKSNSWFMKYNWTVLNALEHASHVHSIHASYRLFFFIFLCSNSVWCYLPLVFFVSFWFPFWSVLSFPFLSLASWLGRLEPIKKLPPPLPLPSIVIGFSLRKTKKPMKSWTYLCLSGLRGKWC